MKNMHQLAICGLSCSGKGSVIYPLADYFNIPIEGIQSIGTLRRKFGLEKYGLEIDELNKLRETKPEVDTEFDDFQKEYMATHEKWIVEGRLPYFFAPTDSIKIFLSVDKTEAAKRMFFRDEKSEKKYNSIKDALETIKKREQSDKETYWNLYKTNCYDVTNFDIILDTTEMDKKEVYHKVIERIERIVLSNF